MKLFKSSDFFGIHPVGATIVVLAEDETAARTIILKQLKESGNEHEDNLEIIEVDMSVAGIVEFVSGEY